MGLGSFSVRAEEKTPPADRAQYQADESPAESAILWDPHSNQGHRLIGKGGAEAPDNDVTLRVIPYGNDYSHVTNDRAADDLNQVGEPVPDKRRLHDQPRRR
jgi:hypothetical protein